MTDKRKIKIIPLFLAVLCLLCSCEKKSEDLTESNVSDAFFNGYAMNDAKTLESALTKEYDLNELKAFFKDSNANESAGFGEMMKGFFGSVDDALVYIFCE